MSIVDFIMDTNWSLNRSLKCREITFARLELERNAVSSVLEKWWFCESVKVKKDAIKSLKVEKYLIDFIKYF